MLMANQGKKTNSESGNLNLKIEDVPSTVVHLEQRVNSMDAHLSAIDGTMNHLAQMMQDFSLQLSSLGLTPRSFEKELKNSDPLTQES